MRPHTLLLALALMPGVTLLQAIELAELTGDWNLAEFESPVALKEIYYNVDSETTRTSVNSADYAGRTGANEFITFAYYPDPLLTVTRAFTISGSGAVTGGETGEILKISGNRILYFDGEGSTTVYSNSTGDVLLTSSRNADRQGQTLCLKEPASLATSELAGDWRFLSMINPSDIETNIIEGRLADTYFEAEPESLQGEITINANGSFGGLFSGTLSAGAPGHVTVNPSDGGSVSFICNASKNLMLSTPGDASKGEYIVLVRQPASLATADFEGTWRISTILIPTTLTENFYHEANETTREADSGGSAQPGERLVDVYHRDPYELQRLQILVDASGSFTGSVNGSLAVVGSAVNVTVDGKVLAMRPNADKTFMAGINTFADSHQLVVCVKTSEARVTSFDQEVDAQPIVTDDKVVISWNSGNNVVLEALDESTGWGAVEGAEGVDAVNVDINSGGTRLFRVKEVSP